MVNHAKMEKLTFQFKTDRRCPSVIRGFYTHLHTHFQ